MQNKPRVVITPKKKPKVVITPKEKRKINYKRVA